MQIGLCTRGELVLLPPGVKASREQLLLGRRFERKGYLAHKKGLADWHAHKLPRDFYGAFFALNFAHLLRCAAAILSRAAADIFRLGPLPAELPLSPLNTAIARSSLSRSCFNCTTTAPISVISYLPVGMDLNNQNHTGGVDHSRHPLSESRGLFVSTGLMEFCLGQQVN